MLVQTMESHHDLSHPRDCFWSKESIKKYELLMQPQNHFGTDPKLELWAFSVWTWLSRDPHQPSELRRRIRQYLYLKWHSNAWEVFVFFNCEVLCKNKIFYLFPYAIALTLLWESPPDYYIRYWTPQLDTNAGNLEAVQKRPTMMMKGLENKI